MLTTGAYNMRFKLQDATLVAPFIVCPDLPHAGIIGMNIMRQHGIILDPVSGKLFSLSTQQRSALALHSSKIQSTIEAIGQTYKEGEPNQVDDINMDPWKITTTRQYHVDPMTARLIRCKLTDASERPVANCDAITTIASIEIAFRTDDHGAFQIYLPNARTEDSEIARGFHLSTARPLEEATPCDQSSAETMLAATLSAVARATPPSTIPPDRTAIGKAIAPTASPQARDFYTRILTEFSDIVSADQHDLGRSDALKHTIELSDNMPVYTQQYRLPLEQVRLVRDHLHAWLKAGIVEKSRSKYNSPVFCVPKKDTNKLRVVLDYRKLNAKCMPDKYSIRPVEQCLEEIGHAKSQFFSCIDLRSGFWQLPLEEKSRHLTAFTIPGVGQFQYTVAPMGLAGSPASFSRLMDYIMRDLSFVITYIDDCLVHSRTERQHADHVRSTLERLRKYRLKINIEKCVFGAQSIQYLGHTISGQGIKPGTDKTAAVANTAPPENIRQVRSFMGLANYFRQFIPGFATIAAPMFALTRDNSAWKRGELPDEAKAAFETLKKAITSEPVLRFHTAEGKYHMYTDAAQGDAVNLGGLGAVLMQEDQNGQKHAVGYASRRLQTHEKNYPAFLLEMQAAVFAMEHFDTHLRGRHFYLYTDHKPLCKLSTVHTKTLNRLQMKMLDMYPQIRHIPGGENSVADFLSRYQGIAAAQVDASPFRIKQLQDVDEELAEFKQTCRNHESYKNGSNSTIVQQGKAKFCLKDDILYIWHGQPDQGVLQDKDLRVCAPRAMHKELLVEAHNSKLVGHQGAYKSLARIQGHFFWPKMDEAMREHVAKCNTCMATTNKGTTDPPRQQQLQIPTGPNWRVHVDLFGPQKCNDGKKRFVLVATDAFTKMVALRVIDDKSANTVATGILESWCYVYGVPKSIISDQGLEFTNELARCLWSALQIKHTTTTPYHPQCNSSAEVFNRTMKRYLAAAIKDAEGSTLDWPLYIAPLMFAYNTSIHKAAKESPFMTTFGYDPRIPLWDDQGETERRSLDKAANADDFFRHKKAQSDTRKIVMNNLQHDQERRATQTEKNVRHSDTEYESGDLVWVRINQTTEPNRKLACTWEPGTIIRRTGFSTYKVRREQRTRKKTATLNATQLKPRTAEEDTTDDENDDHTEDEDENRQDDGEDNTPIAAEAVHIDHGRVIIDNLQPEDVFYLLSQGFTLSSCFTSAQRTAPRPAATTSSTWGSQRQATTAAPKRGGHIISRGKRRMPLANTIRKTARQAQKFGNYIKRMSPGANKKTDAHPPSLYPAVPQQQATPLYPSLDTAEFPATTGPPRRAAFSPPSAEASKLPHNKAIDRLKNYLTAGKKDPTADASSSYSQGNHQMGRRARPPPGTYRE